MCGSPDAAGRDPRPRGPRPRDIIRKGDAPRGTSPRRWYDQQDRKQAGEYRRLTDRLRRVLPRLA